MLLFDCDGVLVDSETGTALALEAWAEARLKLPPAAARVLARSWRGLPTRRLVEDALVAAAGVTGAELDALEAEIDRAARACIKLMPGLDAIPAMPGVKAVVSNASPDWLRLVVAAAGLEETFGTRLFSAEEAGMPKPDPAVYVHAAASLQINPRCCLAVEDSPAGIRAARAAGIEAIGYVGPTAPYAAEEERELLSAGARWVVRSFRQLSALIPGAPFEPVSQTRSEVVHNS